MKKKTFEKTLRTVGQEIISDAVRNIVSDINVKEGMVSGEANKTFQTEAAGEDYISAMKNRGRESDLRKNLEDNLSEKLNEIQQMQNDSAKKVVKKKIKPLIKYVGSEAEKSEKLRKKINHMEKRYEKLEEVVRKQSFLITYLCSGGNYVSYTSDDMDELYKECKRDLKRNSLNGVLGLAPMPNSRTEENYRKYKVERRF